jgi:hypothetical protein
MPVEMSKTFDGDSHVVRQSGLLAVTLSEDLQRYKNVIANGGAGKRRSVAIPIKSDRNIGDFR